MAANLVHDKFWVDKALYHDAEKKYYESLAKLHKNGQKSEESGKTVVQEMNVKKKNSKSKNNQKVSETKNVKNNVCSSGDSRGGYEIIESKEDEVISERDESISEKKPKQKDSKDKKKDKKSKKKDRDENKGGGVGVANVSQESFPKTSLAGEVAKARQHIKSSLESVPMDGGLSNSDAAKLTGVIERLENLLRCLEKRVEALEKKCSTCPPANTCHGQSQTAATKTSVGQVQTVAAKTTVGQSQTKKADDDDDVDLFGSESEEEDEEAQKIKEQRLAEYAARKSKKPALIAKSNIILDVKPWDDETDMKEMEKEVRKIEMDGLLWGASKLVPLAYGIHKLQISCVVEDDKVSVDQLIETLEQIEEYVQSVDIAAFNKI